MDLRTVATVAPLSVREQAGTNPLPARVVRGSSYTPVVGDRVLVEQVAGRLYVMGGG